MDIIITPRLTLRPPWPETRDLDRDAIAALAPALDADAILDGASHIILRERVIGWVGGNGSITLGAAWQGHGLEAEIALAVLRDLHARCDQTAPQRAGGASGHPVSDQQRDGSLSLAC